MVVSIMRDMTDAERVYHITTTDKLGILETGLTPNPLRGKDETWRRVERLVDRERPPEIVEKCIARSSAAFAHPDIWSLDSELSMGAAANKGAGVARVSLEVSVGVDEVVVCDARELRRIYNALFDGPLWDKASSYARSYWESALTLPQYREYYEREDFGLAEKANRRPGAPESLAYTYMPEVLIPGPVPAERIRWAASRLH